MNRASSYARGALLAGMALLVDGCRAAEVPVFPSAAALAPDTPWSPLAEELPGTWRNLQLFEGECAFVLASSDAGARQAHAVARLACQLFADELGRSPRRGLVIAGSKDDQLLVDDADALLAAMARWNAAATGREAPPSRSTSRRRSHRDDVPPELAVRLSTVGIPVDEPVLGLPAPLRQQIAYVVLLPSDDCIEMSCAAIIEMGLEREGVSWFKKMLVKASIGPASQPMVREFRALSLATFLEVVSWSEGLEAESADGVLARAVAAGAVPEHVRRRAAPRAERP